MTKEVKKKILISPELESSSVGIFFQGLDLELAYEYVKGEEYLFAVNSICPEVVDIPRLQTRDELNPKLKSLVRSYISEDLFSIPQGQKLLSSYFTDAQEFDLVDRYSKDFKNIYNFKVHEYLNIGFFVDSIIVEGYKAGFDIEVLRNYLHSAMTFAFTRIESSEDSLPIEVSYSHNGEAFTVQISLVAESFSGKDEFKDILDTLTKNSNFFDVSFFEKKKKLTLSSLVFKDQSFKKSKSYFFTEIVKRSNVTQVEDTNSEIHSGVVLKDSIRYDPTKLLDGASRKLAIARTFATFIKKYRAEESSPKPLEELQLIDISFYLTFYPKEEHLSELDDEIRSFILKFLKDNNLFDSMAEHVQKVASSNLDEKISEIQRILGEKSLDDIQEAILVRGEKTDTNDINRVKAWTESTDDEGTKISGTTDVISDNEKWELKKSELQERIQEEVKRITSEGRNVVEDDIIRVVANQLNTSESDVKAVVSGIVEEAISSDLAKNQKLEEAFARKVLDEKAANIHVEKLESQVTRMKKIIDQMKNEMIKMHKEKVARELAGDGPIHTKNLELKAALGKTMGILKNKEVLLDKLKTDFEMTVKNKDQNIDFLLKRVEDSKNELNKIRTSGTEEKLQALEAENRSLTSKLEQANKKVTIISENIASRSTEILGKRDHVQAQETPSTELFGKSVLAEKDAMIQTITTEKKMLEEKFKNVSMELKKAEQKLKFTASQLEASSKKKGGAAAGQKTSEAHSKQLEQANSRVAEVTAEVSEKRKEIGKLKQENSNMSAKIIELEKKLADKKAA